MPTILLVEDDPELASVLQHILTACSYEVHLARDGAKALKALRSGLRASLVVLDLVMPNLDGAGVLDALHAEPELASIPTLVITGDRRADPSALRASACFQKPFEGAAFLAEVARLLAHR